MTLKLSSAQLEKGVRKLGKETLGGTDNWNKEQSVPGAGEGVAEPTRCHAE